MSRLDSAIRRLEAQRDLLNLAARRIGPVGGPILELGLGNGRTFDHLRTILPGREIYVFERKVQAHPACIPDQEHLFEGDFAETLKKAAEKLGPTASLAHLDIGSGNAEQTAATAGLVSRELQNLLDQGALVISDQPLDWPSDWVLPLPDSIAPGRLHFYAFQRTA